MSKHTHSKIKTFFEETPWEIKAIILYISIGLLTWMYTASDTSLLPPEQLIGGFIKGLFWPIYFMVFTTVMRILFAIILVTLVTALLWPWISQGWTFLKHKYNEVKNATTNVENDEKDND